LNQFLNLHPNSCPTARGCHLFSNPQNFSEWVLCTNW